MGVEVVRVHVDLGRPTRNGEEPKEVENSSVDRF